MKNDDHKDDDVVDEDDKCGNDEDDDDEDDKMLKKLKRIITLKHPRNGDDDREAKAVDWNKGEKGGKGFD